MPISVQCAQCGKQYQVGDNLAGKRIKCKDCSAIVSVPATAPAAQPVAPTAQRTAPAASADSIPVTCSDCGKQFQAKASLAGKRVKCQQCGGVVTVPGASSPTTASPSPAAKSKPAAPAAARPPQRAAAPAAAAHNPWGSLLDEAGAIPSMPSMGQMYCPNCKAIISADAVLCVQCGLKLETGRTMLSKNTANKPVYNPGRMTAWGYIAGSLGILYAMAAVGFNALMMWGSIVVLMALGLPNEENPGSVYAFFGLPVFLLMFTAGMLLLVSSINILRSIKGAIPNAALSSKIFVGAYMCVVLFLGGLMFYGIYKASKTDAGAAAAANVNKKPAAPPPTFRGPAAMLYGFTLAAAVTVQLVLSFVMVTLMVVGVPIFIWIFAATQGKHIDWALPEAAYKGKKGGLKVIDPTKKPELIVSKSGIRCPSCGSGESDKVRFTWWGGMLGPVMFSVVRCRGCNRQYNGSTGGDLTVAIALYFGFFLILGLIGGVAAFMARSGG